MNHKSRAHSISWFQDQYKDGRLELRPPFQRKPVWSDKQRCALIESILLDIPIPEVYVQVTQADDGTEEYGVVDGQQRLRTILQFIGIEHNEEGEAGDNNNSFKLESLPTNSPYKDKVFTDVTGDARRKFYQFEICVRYLYTDNSREVEEVFKRLNKYLLPLKPQELRNATYHGPFPKLAEQLADDDYWAVNRIISPASIRRVGDIEMMSDLLIGLLHGPQGGASKIIDQYYEQYEQFEDEFPEQNRIKRLFVRTLEAIKRLFPEIAEVPRWGNRADYYSLFVAIGDLLEDHSLSRSSEAKIRDKLIGFAKDIDEQLEDPSAETSELSKRYARAIEKASNDKARRADRHETLCRIIKPFLKKKS